MPWLSSSRRWSPWGGGPPNCLWPRAPSSPRRTAPPRARCSTSGCPPCCRPSTVSGLGRASPSSVTRLAPGPTPRPTPASVGAELRTRGTSRLWRSSSRTWSVPS
eukprot:12187769-Alexandrium_andersonii.AAC.1